MYMYTNEVGKNFMKNYVQVCGKFFYQIKFKNTELLLKNNCNK